MTTIPCDTMDASEPLSVAAKFNVTVPPMPMRERLENVAAPLALVVAVTTPPSAAPPVAIVAVTNTPELVAALPNASRSWITGCCGSANPAGAVVEGWVVTVS